MRKIVGTFSALIIIVFLWQQAGWTECFSLRARPFDERKNQKRVPSNATATRREFLKQASMLVGAISLGLGSANVIIADELENFTSVKGAEDPISALIVHRAENADKKKELNRKFIYDMETLLSFYNNARDAGDLEEMRHLWKRFGEVINEYLFDISEIDLKQSRFIRSHFHEIADKMSAMKNKEEGISFLADMDTRAARNSEMAKRVRDLNVKLMKRGILFLPEEGQNLLTAQAPFLTEPGRKAFTDEEAAGIWLENFNPLIKGLLGQKQKFLDAEIRRLKKEMDKKPAGQTIRDYEANIAILSARWNSFAKLSNFLGVISDEASTDEVVLNCQQGLNQAVLAEQTARTKLAELHEERAMAEYELWAAKLQESEESEEASTGNLKKEMARYELVMAGLESRRCKLIEEIIKDRAALGLVLFLADPQRSRWLNIRQEYEERLLLCRMRGDIAKAFQEFHDSGETLIHALASYGQADKTADKSRLAAELKEVSMALEDLEQRQIALSSIVSGLKNLHKFPADTSEKSDGETLYNYEFEFGEDDEMRLRAQQEYLQYMQPIEISLGEVEEAVSLARQYAREAGEGLLDFDQPKRRRIEEALPKVVEIYTAIGARWIMRSQRREEIAPFYFELENIAMYKIEIPGRLDDSNTAQDMANLQRCEKGLLELERQRIDAEIEHLKYGPFNNSDPLLQKYIEQLKAQVDVVDTNMKVSENKKGYMAGETYLAYQDAQTRQILKQIEFAESMKERFLAELSSATYNAPGDLTRVEYIKTAANFWNRRIFELKETLQNRYSLVNRARPLIQELHFQHMQKSVQDVNI